MRLEWLHLLVPKERKRIDALNSSQGKRDMAMGKEEPLDFADGKEDNMRRFPQGNLGVIRFRRDAWRPDCASRILVGLVKKREKRVIAKADYRMAA